MRVLLGIDGSPHSHAALVEFAKRPWPNRTEVQIVTVIHPSFPLVMDPLFIGVSAHVQRAEELRNQAPALSVASAVVAKAPCSVQVVRGKNLLNDSESAA